MDSKTYTDSRDKAALSIKKANGIVSKTLSMIEDGKYCPEVIQQIDAAIGLLKSSKKSLLVGHLDHCMLVKLKQNKKEAIDELVRIFDLDK